MEESMRKILFTSESVSEGHPDKICDQIADAILDACLEQDPQTRLACEVLITTNMVIIGGEIKSSAIVNYEAIARKVICDIGYIDEKIGINGNTCHIQVLIHSQSQDIILGVEHNHQLAAGDQGIIFGYATNETKTYMPLAIQIAHDLVHLASSLRKNQQFKDARPDMKSQVTIDYTDWLQPKIDTILMSIQHHPDYNESEFKTFIHQKIMLVIAKKYNLNFDFKFLINPTGRFVVGGPYGDTGLTGRKIIADTYGGYARSGGGAFSGKDATKVDRAAAYMARKVAKHIVALNWADKCEIQLAYAIGMKDPIAVYVETFNTEKIALNIISGAVSAVFDFSMQGVIDCLQLMQPIYQKTTVYGHFGKDDNFSWEKLDCLEQLKDYIKDK
ncbi:methionine adenosyltransferase [Spiroplasma endosymbiont of Agriotes lineatus]|uniref:methionine adenosyltransferase n=1 Tax=Spiroplasma endosymbiont of Agriotes lineatus TaxID=3077930 RepID=UPI003BB0BA50